MVNTLSVSFGSQASTANVTRYWNCFNATFTQFGTNSEAISQTILRSAGTLSNMSIRITANTVAGNSIFTCRKNTAAGNQTVTVGSSATGIFTDSTHTDTIAAGDKVCVQSVPGATTNTFTVSVISFLFGATTNTVSRLNTSNSNAWSSSGVLFFTPVGDNTNSGGTATESQVKVRQRKAGTMQNGEINISANANTAASTMLSRKNGANGNLSVSITGSTTGFFEDTTHSDTIAAGDDYNWTWTSGASLSTTVETYAVDFISTGGDGQIVMASDSAATQLKTVTTYRGLGGALATSTTEAFTSTVAGSAFTFSELTIVVSTNTVTLASILTLRANAGAAGSISVSVTASTAAVFSDSVHTYVALSSDLVDTQFVTGTTGTSLTFRSIGIWTNLTAVVVPLYMQPVVNQWIES